MGLNKKYETGILWQDTQHQQLIELMEKLSDSNAKEADPKMFTYTTAFLAMYVTHHFNLEEQYMETYGYPDLKLHIAEHHKYIDIIKKFRRENTQFSAEGSAFLEENILKWILDHIMENDQKLGAFIRIEERKRILAEET
ncbi:MAG: hemerythrin family protein [Proteobacteria bacterium]|nr:bacteriohemerythrin [Desulfobacula sp.]MBU3951244.1 hemerythrin family protein [Pseudomonadota bacterium]MBU4132983.1 hemerythrin family protein [Pseudomonadota bacterium]